MMKKGFIKGIDGLRALAVLAVIIYHLNPVLLPGGFTGVDIFFVISGYVVAKSLDARKEQPFRAFIGDFYQRRILRIYPALLACLIITSLFVVLFIPQFHVSRAIENTALAAFFGVSNFALALNTDTYFSPGAEFNPFIHTWSLGVEEQFYLIFPFLFYLYARNTAKYSMHILLLISLGLCYYHTSTNGNHAYYLISSRFWELAAGCILYKTHQLQKSHSQWFTSAKATFLGIVAIFVSLAFSDKGHFPFPWALFSVLGTCLLIHAIIEKGEQKSRFLDVFEHPLAVHFGKLSYSLYLWHWPVFTLFRWTSGLESPLEVALALTITYVFSTASYYLLESKFTHLNVIKQQSSKTVLVSGVSIIVVCYLAVQIGFNGQYKVSLSQTTNKPVWSPYTRIPEPLSGLPFSGRTMYVFGDSHAGAYGQMLRQLSQETGIKVEMFSKGGCGVSNLLHPVLVPENPCYEQLSAWLDVVKKQATKDDIIFLATLKMSRLTGQSSVHPSNVDEVIRQQQGSKAQEQRQLALAETLTVLEELELRTKLIVLDAPKPVFNYVAFRCADWYSESNPICSEGFNQPRKFIEEFRQPTLTSLLKIQEALPSISIWDPLDSLCTEKNCSAYDGDLPLYFDGDHLSGHGNKVLYTSFKQHILTLVTSQASGQGFASSAVR